MDPYAPRFFLDVADTGVSIDFSTMIPAEGLDVRLASTLEAALLAMRALDAGALANPDEGRQVGHYWLRAPELAPDPALGAAILDSHARLDAIVGPLLSGIRPDTVLHLGIGGSALGPQLLASALASERVEGAVAPDRYRVLDNTDPEGIALGLRGLDPTRCLVVVVSKSGGTPETRNALALVRRFFGASGTPLAPRALAVTEEGSLLDCIAREESWAGRLPMWSWVGGRTSLCSAVGLLPLALMGQDRSFFLGGAAAMDRACRLPLPENPAALLAASWRLAQTPHARAMVVLPYADRLGHLGRYLQQLVMESLGKRLDRKGREIRAGLAVYGNKGSTDQHAFVQQLRDGPDDFFATFVELLAPSAPDPEVEPGVTAGDYLSGFLLGTRAALAEDGKRSLHVALERLSPWTLGALIALFERAVGIYGELLDLNAYHQPGVEAGKRAATRMLGLQKALIAALGHEARGVHELAESVGLGDPMAAWFILRRLALRGDRGVIRRPGATPLDDTFVAAR